MTNDTRDIADMPVAQPEQSGKADADMARIEAAMKGMREQQDIELKEDVAAFDNRPKPAYYQDSAPPAADVREGAHWEDRGIIDVPVADLPQPEGVDGPQDFNHHIKYEDAVSATRTVQEMKPQIDAGYTSDDFADLDKAKGLNYEHGQQRVYDLYYGSDPIAVDKDGDKYDIVSGRHRIFAAKEIGLDFIPARVKEKVPG